MLVVDVLLKMITVTYTVYTCIISYFITVNIVKHIGLVLRYVEIYSQFNCSKWLYNYVVVCAFVA